jgi:hypothetical protein
MKTQIYIYPVFTPFWHKTKRYKLSVWFDGELFQSKKTTYQRACKLAHTIKERFSQTRIMIHHEN